MIDLAITGGRVLDPVRALDVVGDVLIDDGKIMGVAVPGEGPRARAVVGNKSPSSDVDAGEHVASPMPTPRRATTNCEKVRAMPDAAVRRLQTNTPPARMRRRAVLSERRPSGSPKTA